MQVFEPTTATTEILSEEVASDSVVTTDVAAAAELPADKAAPKPRETAIAEIQSRMFAQRQTLREVEAEWEEAHSEAGILKKRMEKNQETLNKIVDELQQTMNGDSFNPSLPFEAAMEPVTDEAWKQTDLTTLGLTGKLAETLQEAGLSTLGQIVAYTESGKVLTDIKGIGQGKAEKIDDACAAFWETQRALSATTVEETKRLGEIRAAGRQWAHDCNERKSPYEVGTVENAAWLDGWDGITEGETPTQTVADISE